MELTLETAYRWISEFFENQKPFVLFGTGTSCSLDVGFGMPALERRLRDRLPSGLNADQLGQWRQVTSAIDGGRRDFESAMDFVLDSALTSKIVSETACFLAELDHRYSHQILSGKLSWPAAKLFNKLVSTLPPTDPQLHIATTNYDLLAEYAFVREGVPYLTGFHGNYCRQYCWQESANIVRRYRGSGAKRRSQIAPYYEQRHIRLHKPHGSLNTFEIGDRVVECDAWIRECPRDVSRSMITPGTAKYQRLHDDRTRLGDYDRAVQGHSRFLFLGFGFNDSQLVNKVFNQKLEHEGCHALVITRDCNERMTSWLHRCPNMWLVCKQDGSEKTRIFSGRFENWLFIDNKELWRFDHFTREFLGN